MAFLYLFFLILCIFVPKSSFCFRLITLFYAVSHMYLFVCPLITYLHCVLLLHCPPASAPCCVMVPEHNMVLWDVPVLLVQTGLGINGYMGAFEQKGESWAVETRDWSQMNL